MPVLYSVLMTIQVLSAVSIVILVLLQQGKGADMGAAFGSGSAGSVFGAAGSANFLSRTTAVAAKQTGRVYIGCDISDEYCEIAEQRLESTDAYVPEVAKVE